MGIETESTTHHVFIFVHLFTLVPLVFVVAPRTSLSGLLSTVTALPYAYYKLEVLNSLMSMPTHTRGQLQIRTTVRVQHMRLQLGSQNRTPLNLLFPLLL